MYHHCNAMLGVRWRWLIRRIDCGLTSAHCLLPVSFAVSTSFSHEHGAAIERIVGRTSARSNCLPRSESASCQVGVTVDCGVEF